MLRMLVDVGSISGGLDYEHGRGNSRSASGTNESKSNGSDADDRIEGAGTTIRRIGGEKADSEDV